VGKWCSHYCCLVLPTSHFLLCLAVWKEEEKRKGRSPRKRREGRLGGVVVHVLLLLLLLLSLLLLLLLLLLLVLVLVLVLLLLLLEIAVAAAGQGARKEERRGGRVGARQPAAAAVAAVVAAIADVAVAAAGAAGAGADAAVAGHAIPLLAFARAPCPPPQ